MARAAAQPRSTGFPFAPETVRALLRRLRAERDLLAVVVGVVLVTTFVFAAIPRLFNEMADDGLAHAVTTSNPLMRNLQMTQPGRIEVAKSGDDPFALVDQVGQEFQDGLAPSIQQIIGDRKFVIDTPRYRVFQTPGVQEYPFPRYITMRYHQDVDPHLTLIAGHMPQPRSDTLAVSGPLTRDETVDAPIFEVAVSTETARQLAVEVGEQLVMEPFTEDRLVRSVPRSQQNYVVMEISGLFEVNDVDEEYWLSIPTIDRATEYDDGNQVHIYATGVMAAGAYQQYLTDTTFPLTYAWRYFVDPASFDAGDLTQLAADVRRLEAEYSTFSGAGIGETGVTTGLTTIFRRYLSQREVTEAVLSLASIGLLAVAFAVIGLVATLVAERRRQMVALVRGRGGSVGQLAGAQVVEGLLLTIPSALLGLLLASVIVAGRFSIWSIWAVVVIAGVTTLLLVTAALPIIRQGLGAAERSEVPVTRVSLRRVVLDLLIVALALVGVYLLRRRGLTGDSSSDEINEWDPYLAAVPVLLGLATGLVVLRLYPLPVRLFGWAAGLRRDLVPALGFRRLGRQPGSSNLPLLVMLLAVAVGVLSSIMLYTIGSGQTESSWQLVGADYRVDAASGYLVPSIDLSEVSGVEAIATSYMLPDVKFANRSPIIGTTYFHALDATTYEEVTRGTPADPHLPGELLDEPRGTDFGQPTNPIPAVVSDHFSRNQLRPGDTFALTVFGRETTFVVVESRERFAGIPIGRPFVVTSLELLEASNPDRMFRPTAMFLRAPESAFDAIDTTLTSQSISARLTSRDKEYAKVHDSPLISGVEGGFKIGLVLAGAYSALAVVIALTITAHARARDLAFLRTMGLSREQAIGLTIVEQLPLVVLALVAGTLLGVAVARLIEPGVDLQAFTGEGLPVELRINWVNIGLLGLGLVATVAIAVAVTSSLARRASLGQALRLGDE
ncbi:MAG TPA: FtsX-like permease family protein [Thermomicrobiales bacterium]|nr:FtsX-like permease family protein [Thermomicrobiales bacterium]